MHKRDIPTDRHWAIVHVAQTALDLGIIHLIAENTLYM